MEVTSIIKTKAVYLIIVCLILHNFILYWGDLEEYFFVLHEKNYEVVIEELGESRK